MPDGDSRTPLGWWAISGEALLAMLRRCLAGENPDLVYAEEYANAGHEHIPPEEGEMTRQDKIDSLAEAMNRATPGKREEPVAASILRALEGMGWTLLPKFMGGETLDA